MVVERVWCRRPFRNDGRQGSPDLAHARHAGSWADAVGEGFRDRDRVGSQGHVGITVAGKRHLKGDVRRRVSENDRVRVVGCTGNRATVAVPLEGGGFGNRINNVVRRREQLTERGCSRNLGQSRRVKRHQRNRGVRRRGRGRGVARKAGNDVDTDVGSHVIHREGVGLFRRAIDVYPVAGPLIGERVRLGRPRSGTGGQQVINFGGARDCGRSDGVESSQRNGASAQADSGGGDVAMTRCGDTYRDNASHIAGDQRQGAFRCSVHVDAVAHPLVIERVGCWIPTIGVCGQFATGCDHSGNRGKWAGSKTHQRNGEGRRQDGL